MKRYLENQIRDDLKKKMVLLGGPRQVGKTTLARTIQTEEQSYLNWDVDEHRARILSKELPDSPLIVFDEIHKYRKWRNYLKGLYDNPGRISEILVTGSARLDLYRFGGDSLQGRYFYLRLHPLSCAELNIQTSTDLDQLFDLGGFPEPFFGGSQFQAQRWTRDCRARLIQDDVTKLEKVEDLGTLELLILRLPELVGSPLSINALREDLQVSHKTLSKWIDILERMYALFRLAPFGSPKLRAVKKEQKHYHFDWSLVVDPGYRFENMVAVHLQKWVHFEQDTKGRDLDLRYFRDVAGREVDFVVTEKGRPILAVECKLSDSDVSKHLIYFKEKFPEAESFQLHLRGKKDYRTPAGIRVCPAIVCLRDLI